MKGLRLGAKCRPKVAKIPFMMPPSEESDIKAPQGILKVQVCAD